MALSDVERTDLRRHCGYPSYGSGAQGFQGWRFHQAYGLLEFRMTRMSGAEERVARQYLATLAELERAVPASAAMMDTEQAAVWKRNPRELRERTALFDDWRRRLCGFLGVPPGPALRGGGGPVLVV
jgi:hypothetical protein